MILILQVRLTSLPGRPPSIAPRLEPHLFTFFEGSKKLGTPPKTLQVGRFVKGPYTKHQYVGTVSHLLFNYCTLHTPGN